MKNAAVTQIINLLQDKVPQGYNQLIRETVASAKMFITFGIGIVILGILTIIGGILLINSMSDWNDFGIIFIFIGSMILFFGIAVVMLNIGALRAPNVSLIQNLISD